MIKLNENIKKYRLQKCMTQAQLASVFNVSEQAVSRWENGNTYPDISLLPAMADYFGITIDELMGMESYKDERETEKIIEIVKDNERKGLIRENITLLSEAARKYPTNYVILNYLVSQLTFENCEDEAREKANCEKAIEIADRVLNECNDRGICNQMLDEKIIALQKLGRIDEAIKIADEQPSIWGSCNYRLMQLYTGDTLKMHCKDNVSKFAQAMYYTIQNLADLNFEDNSLTIRERINIAKKALEILDVVYEGDYGTECRLVAQMTRYIAAMEVLEGEVDATLEYLEKAVEYSIKYDTLPETVKLTSTLLKGKEVKSSVFKNITWNVCAELSERLAHKRYDLVRDTERFKAVEKRAAEHAAGCPC